MHSAGKRPYDVELQLRTKSRGYRWFRTRARCTLTRRAVPCACQRHPGHHDHKLAQLALSESQAFLERMGQVAGVGAWATTSRPSVCIPARRGASTMLMTWLRTHAEGPQSGSMRLKVALCLKRPPCTAVFVEGKGWDLELPFVTATGLSGCVPWARWKMTNGQPVMLSVPFRCDRAAPT